MEDKELEENIKKIAELVVNLKYFEWTKIVMAIDKKFSSAQTKVGIGASTDEIINAIKLEF